MDLLLRLNLLQVLPLLYTTITIMICTRMLYNTSAFESYVLFMNQIENVNIYLRTMAGLKVPELRFVALGGAKADRQYWI